jgi:monoamine oxidase
MIGYDVLGANANAVDIIAENFDFTKDTKYYLMNEGYESVVWHLAEEFIAAGGTVVMNHELAAVGDGSGETPFSLTFQQGEALAARAVVLAMPPAAIRRLNRSGPLLDPARAPGVPGLLSSVSGIPLYKLFLVYDRPWWNDHAGLSAGRSITDLPVRQCYYWRTQPGGPSMIMAYNDLDSTSFWGGYQLGAQQVGNTVTDKGAASRPYVLPGFSDPAARSQEYLRRKRDNWTNHVAPQAMVMEMHHQLKEMHGVPGAPDPIDAAFMDWMNEPYGGAVHFWNPGCKSHELARTIVQPVDGLNAFIVGEAFSNGQTWVEGALQTSELLLQERLGLSAPDWLSEGQGGGA